MLGPAMLACSDPPRVGPRIDPGDPCAGVAATSFDAVWASHFSGCSTCHESGEGGFAFSSQLEMWQHSVGQPSNGNPGMLRVAPGDPLNSYLYLKLLPDAGTRMPLNGPYLDEGGLEDVLGWICSEPLRDENPVPSIASISPDTVVGSAGTFTLTVHGEAFVTGSELEMDGLRLATTVQSSSELVAVVDASAMSLGLHTVTAWNPPPGGGTSGGAILMVVNPAPSISSIWPDTVAAGSAAFALSIVGAGFLPGSTVEIDGLARDPVTYVSGSQLTVDVPASDVADLGARTVTVSNPAPGGGTSNGATLTVAASQPDNPVPSISSILPSTIDAGTAQPALTITGSGFVPGSEAAIDGAPRLTRYVSDAELTADLLGSDVATVGTLAVTITNPPPGGGTSVENVAVSVEHPVPSVSAISPSVVGVDPGPITLAVQGTGFFPVSTVQIGGLDRATTWVSGSQLTADLIAGDVGNAGELAVTVSNPAPGGGTSAAVTLTVTDVPSISSLSPCGIVRGAGAFPLTITGLNFADGATVTFDGTPVTTVVRDGPTQLTATIPAALVATAPPDRAVPVVAANPGGQSTNTVYFGVAGQASMLSPDVQDIFDTWCIGCHKGGGGVGLDLRRGYSYASLVGVASAKCSGNPRVLACGPLRTQSVLVDAILATDGSKVCSQVGQMPKSGGPLPDAAKLILIDWVARGAPP